MSKLLILRLTPNRTSQELSIPELAAAGFLSAIPTTLVTARTFHLGGKADIDQSQLFHRFNYSE